MIWRALLVFALLFAVQLLNPCECTCTNYISSAAVMVDGQPANACYGTDRRCDYYSMQCASNQIIRLYNLYAGYKNTTQYPVCGTANHCASQSTCCSMDYVNDLVENLNDEETYKVYYNCSGKSHCTSIQAPWQQMTQDTSLVSSYVQLEYECEDASSKVPFCGGTGGRSIGEYSNVEIMFDGSIEAFDPSKASKECQCSVTNLGQQQNVVFTAIDIRLQTYFKSENQTFENCSSAIFQSPVFGVRCVESSKHYEDNFDRSRQLPPLKMPQDLTVTMSLTDIHANGRRDSPAMVWISLRAEPDSGIRVTCEEVIPADLTTTSTTTTTPRPTTTTTSTTTTTTTTTTTPKPTTTTTTTTPKPTTTTPKPTTTTPKPTTTTTTPKPTTTTPKPTTTTPKPTTTTTTPKPTTTTPKPTTTTPKPTTTTTTPKPTTTTPKPTTTTTTTTPKPTTTTPKPATTTTTTTPKPTTTTPKPTTTTPKPTTTTTTPKPTTTTPKPTTTTTKTTSTEPATTEAAIPKQGDGESDLKQRTAVYLAICIPVIACLFIITAFLLWLYWKRTSPRRKKFHFMKDTPRSEVYNNFSNPKILDDFIGEMGVEPTSPVIPEKRPISTFISVPEPNKRPRSILSNGSVHRQEPVPPIQPYVIPIQATKGDPLYTTPKKGPVPSMVHVRLNQGQPDDGPVVITDTVEPGGSKNFRKINPVYDPGLEDDVIETPREGMDQSQNKPRRKPDADDGGIVIHVDNLGNPLLSRRSTNANTSANTSTTRSQIGSTPGNLTPERRNSEPALITTDPILDRHSASAYVLPGSSPEDSSVLFVK